MGYSKSSPKREAYSNGGLPQEARKFSINNLTFHLRELVKQEQIKLKASRRREIIEIKAEINDIQTTKRTD